VDREIVGVLTSYLHRQLLASTSGWGEHVVVLNFDYGGGKGRRVAVQRVDTRGGRTGGKKAGRGVGELWPAAHAIVPDVELVQTQAVIVRVLGIGRFRLDDELVLDRTEMAVVLDLALDPGTLVVKLNLVVRFYLNLRLVVL